MAYMPLGNVRVTLFICTMNDESGEHWGPVVKYLLSWTICSNSPNAPLFLCPCPLAVPSHTDSGFSHVTPSVLWDISRDIKSTCTLKHVCLLFLGSSCHGSKPVPSSQWRDHLQETWDLPLTTREPSTIPTVDSKSMNGPPPPHTPQLRSAKPGTGQQYYQNSPA